VAIDEAVVIGRIRRRHEQSREAGFSLIELIVATGIFLMIMGVITASVISMMSQTRREGGQSDNLDSARKIIQDMDKTARYANNVSTPGTGTDGGSYVEYRTGNASQQQTCWQWRYLPSTGQVQQRHWLPPLAGGGSSTATSWILEGTGISLNAGAPIWSITPTSASNTHEVLAVQFKTTHGAGPAISQTNQATFTAINTASSAALPSICTEIGRP
jgi:type II secretory pathway pseudopilin PulG